MPNYVIWVTYRIGKCSDGYDYVVRAPDIQTARRKARAYAAKEQRKTGFKVSVKVQKDSHNLV